MQKCAASVRKVRHRPRALPHLCRDHEGSDAALVEGVHVDVDVAQQRLHDCGVPVLGGHPERRHAVGLGPVHLRLGAAEQCFHHADVTLLGGLMTTRST